MIEGIEYPIDEDIFYIFTDWASRSVFDNKYKKKIWRRWWKGIWFIYYIKKWKDIILNRRDKSDYISYKGATNNDMEVNAALDALQLVVAEDLSHFRKVFIITDSEYLCKCSKLAKSGIRNFTWWKTVDGDPVIHKRERKKLKKYVDNIYQEHKRYVDFDRVKAHSKDENNKRADSSAVQWAQSIIKRKWGNATNKARLFKKDENKITKGYLDSIGWQQILIHTYLNKPAWKKQFRDNYEIVSWEDPEYFMKCWRVSYQWTPLSSEFIYLVKMSENGHQIEEILERRNKEEVIKEMLKDNIPVDVFKWKKAIDIYKDVVMLNK